MAPSTFNTAMRVWIKSMLGQASGQLYMKYSPEWNNIAVTAKSTCTGDKYQTCLYCSHAPRLCLTP